MILDIIQAFFGLLLTFFLPGFALTRAMFPRKKAFHPDYDILYQIAIGITLSLIIVIMLGVTMQSIGENPTTGMGYFTTAYLVLFLLLITSIFFAIGWWRGAYPNLGWIHPKLRRIPSSPAVARLVKDRKKLMALHDLVGERETILKEIHFCEKRAATQEEKMRKHYVEKLKLLYERLEIVNAQIDKLEGGVFERYARMKLRTSYEEGLDAEMARVSDKKTEKGVEEGDSVVKEEGDSGVKEEGDSVVDEEGDSGVKEGPPTMEEGAEGAKEAEEDIEDTIGHLGEDTEQNRDTEGGI